jgi:urease accessory protein
MYDGACLSDPVLLQRAVGELSVSVKRYGDETVLDGLRQAGCLKARFPKRVTAGWLDAVMLNTGGGVAAGDRLDLAFSVAARCSLTVTAQAAERFYRARPDDRPSRVRTVLSVAEGGALEWLPQETILFDRSALDRQLTIQLAPDARFLGVETLVFGRSAMGERVGQGWLRDLFRVRRGEDLLLHDAIRLDGAIDATLSRRTIGSGAGAVATLVYVAPDAETRLLDVRGALTHPAMVREGRPSTAYAQDIVESGVSAWNGMLIARILGPESAGVRRALIAALTVLRAGRPLPRVWLC